MSMAVSKRIRFFRKLRGMTQKRLGVAVGFPEKTADTRVAQYETDARGPKAALRERFAAALGVSVDALSIPDMDTPAGLMHTLFALEDLRGLMIGKLDGEICLRLDNSKGTTYLSMLEMLSTWEEQAEKLKAGEITKEEYDRWRYNYPQYDAARNWGKIPSKEFSDALVKQLKRSLGKD